MTSENTVVVNVAPRFAGSMTFYFRGPDGADLGSVHLPSVTKLLAVADRGPGLGQGVVDVLAGIPLRFAVCVCCDGVFMSRGSHNVVCDPCRAGGPEFDQGRAA